MEVPVPVAAPEPEPPAGAGGTGAAGAGDVVGGWEVKLFVGAGTGVVLFCPDMAKVCAVMRLPIDTTDLRKRESTG